MPDIGFTTVMTTLAKDFGLFVTLVVVLIWLLRDAFKWASINIIVPLVTKHLKFLDDLNLSWDRFELLITKVVETQDRLVDSQEVIIRKLDEIDPKISRSRKVVDASTSNS